MYLKYSPHGTKAALIHILEAHFATAVRYQHTLDAGIIAYLNTVAPVYLQSLVGADMLVAAVPLRSRSPINLSHLSVNTAIGVNMINTM